MGKVEINQILTDEEIKRYCETNNKTLIYTTFKENKTILNIIWKMGIVQDNKKYFDIIREEKENCFKLPSSFKIEENYLNSMSYDLLKVKDFWFSLGYNRYKNLSISGNCCTFSNAFNIEINTTNKKYIVELLELINIHNNITLKQLKHILKILKENINKIFFCKENTQLSPFRKEYLNKFENKLTFHYFLENEHNDLLNFLVLFNEFEEYINLNNVDYKKGFEHFKTIEVIF